MNLRNFLLVEGNSDKALFQSVCDRFSVRTKIHVSSPKDISGYFNTKGGVFNNIPIMLKQLQDGSAQKFAVIVDADYADRGGMGYAATFERFKKEVGNEGYYYKKKIGKNGGLIFGHNNGLDDIGLWIMPDNTSDGMVENWLSGSLSTKQTALFEYARSSVASIPHPKMFNDFHTAKAEFATLLAWQKIPGQDLRHCVTDDIIDQDRDSFKEFIEWLRTIFS